jgi:hypothetical protein
MAENTNNSQQQQIPPTTHNEIESTDATKNTNKYN